MPRVTPKIPQGLEELMLNLAKSIIKENPQNIYEFAAEYFEKLLKERDGKVDESYKKLPVYKAYKRAKLEKNRLEVEGIKVALEERRRAGSARTSRSFSRSSSASKSVEKLPKIASSSAEIESETVEVHDSRKSARKLPNISGTAAKVAIGTAAVGIVGAAVKPSLMAVKPQRKSEENVEFNDDIEDIPNVEISTQNSSGDGSYVAEIEVDTPGLEAINADSEINDNPGNLDSSPENSTEAQNSEQITENPEQNSGNFEINSTDLQSNPTDSVLDYENSRRLNEEQNETSEDPNLPETSQSPEATPSDDFIECSTVDVNFLNRESTENVTEIIENVIDINEHEVDGNVGDKMNEISEIASNGNNDNCEYEVDMVEKIDENSKESENFESNQEIEVAKLIKKPSINSATSGENDYYSSNPSIKSSEFSNLSSESVKYEVLNVSSDTQENQSFDDNYAANIEVKSEDLEDIDPNSKLNIDDEINLSDPEPKIEEPSAFGAELINKIRFFEENNEILEDSEEIFEDMETKFEKFGEIMRKIEESDEKINENVAEINDDNDSLKNDLNLTDDKLDAENKTDVMNHETNSELNSAILKENEEVLTKNVHENSEISNEEREKLQENDKNLDCQIENDQDVETPNNDPKEIPKLTHNSDNNEQNEKHPDPSQDEIKNELGTLEEIIENSEYDQDDFNPEDPIEISGSPVKNILKITQNIHEDSKIFEQEVINIENILESPGKNTNKIDDQTMINDVTDPQISRSDDKITQNLDNELIINPQDMNPNALIAEIDNSPEISADSTKSPQNPSTPQKLQSPDYYQEVDSKATTAEMKDDEFIFKSHHNSDMNVINEQKFTVENKSTKESAQGNESEISAQNDIELSQRNVNEVEATGSDNENGKKEKINVEFANEIDSVKVEENEGTENDQEKDKAAVKIQSMFRGYQVRKLGKIQKFEEKLEEIVNNKIQPKVEEPSEFGTELIGKIRDFEENNEILDDTEEIIEDMETKFEKFGEIMRKIEESNEKVDENSESAVDGNVTENAKDEDLIDILLNQPNQESKTRAKRSISPENGEIIEKSLKIEPEDLWAEDFDALKVTKIQEVTASKATKHENLSTMNKNIEDQSTTPKNSNNVDPKDSSIQDGIDEVDTNADGQDSCPPDSDPADNIHPSYSDDEKVKNKGSIEHVTILNIAEQTNDDELIEAQTKNYEGKETRKINEIVTKVEECTENVNKVINSDVVSDINNSENIDANSIKIEEESKVNLEERSKSGHENPTNFEITDAIESFNEEYFDKTTDEVTELHLDKSGENLVTNLNMLENVQNSIKNDDITLDNSTTKQLKDSNDLIPLIDYQVLPSPPTDSPGSSENEENFNEIVQNLSENLSENNEVELKFENIADDVENIDENVKKFDENSKKFAKKIDQNLEDLNKNDENLQNFEENTENLIEIEGSANNFDISKDTTIKIEPDSTQDKNPENTHKNAQIFDKYLDIYDENLENFEYFTNNPDGTLKKSHKIVEKLNEIVEDELAKYVEKMEEIESDDRKSITGLMTENEDSRQPLNIDGDAQFDIFEYAVPSDAVEADKLIDETQNSSLLNDEKMDSKLDNENLTPKSEIIEEKDTKQEIKPQLSGNIPILHQNNLKNETKPEKFSDEIENAAVKIQSFFRGFKVRKSSKPKKSSLDPSIFGSELVDKIQEFEVKSEILVENSEEINEDMETKFEKFGEIMKKIEESNEKIEESNEKIEESNEKIEESNEKVEELVEKVNIQGDPASKYFEKNVENLEQNLKIPIENLILKASISKQNQQVEASNLEEKQKLIPTENILNPLQGLENLSKKFEHKLEENSAEQAAVKIQSLFRGFKVRKSNPPRKYKQTVKEPSAFGSELLDKIEEFEEKDEKLEENIEDMETKFKKFGEIMRKIEKSENAVDGLNENSQIENEESYSKISQELEIIVDQADQNQPKAGSNENRNYSNLEEKDENSTKCDDKIHKSQDPTSQDASKTSDDTEKANAAVKIQSFFRGFKVRKSNQKKIQEPSEFGSELIEKIQDFEVNNENSEEILENMEDKFEKFGEIMRKIEESEEKLEENLCGKINIEVENSDLKNENFEILNENNPKIDDVKLERNYSPKPVPSAPMEDPAQSADDETSAAVKIQSFFRGFKVRKSRKPKGQEPSAFGNELIDKIQDFEAKNEGSDEYVEDMEAKFEKFGEIMKKIEESDEKRENFGENQENLDENKNCTPKSAKDIHENLTENPKNSQNLSQSPLTPEDSPNSPQQKLNPEADQIPDEYEEVDQLSTIYEQNSVEEEPCIEKIVSKCGPDLEQNVNDLNEKVICDQQENGGDEVNSTKLNENVETENEKLIGKPHKEVKIQSNQTTIKNVDFKSQKFVKVGDKFIIVDENLKDSLKTDSEVLENLAKSTEKLSKFSEKLAKSPAKNSSLDETSEKFEDISKQFDQISQEYDKIYKKIEEKFEENSGIQKNNEEFNEKAENFDEKPKSPTKNDLNLTKIELIQQNEIDIKSDPKTSQLDHQNDESTTEQAKAAVKIQSIFRGYKVRKSKFQKFKEDLSEKFNKKSEQEIDEPSIFGSELMEKIKDFKENEKILDDSEEVVVSMETKFEKFGEIMKKIEESGENEIELDEKVSIEGGNFANDEQDLNKNYTNLETSYLIQENIDEFDMDSLEYEVNNQNLNKNIDHSSQINQNSNESPPKLEENAEKSIKSNGNVSENDNFPEKITQKPSKIPIKQKSQTNPENLLDHPQKIPSDPKSINKLSHSADQTPLLSPNNSDPNLVRRQSYIDSVIHEIEGSHVIEGGLYGYGEQFDDLQAANPEILGLGSDFDMKSDSNIENVEETQENVQKNQENVEVFQKIQQISQNPKENFEKIDEKVKQNSPNPPSPIKTYSFFSRNPTIPSSSHQKVIPIAKVQPENIKALTSKSQEKLEPEPKQGAIPSQTKHMKNSMMRQKTMPVQIESSVMRVLPKHLKKRIQSAEGDKKKKKSVLMQ